MVREFLSRIRDIKLSKKYILFAVLYGLTTLILPLGIQFLVNSLALSGIWLNVVGFIIVIGAGLFMSLLLKYSQIVINEYLQRELFMSELNAWVKDVSLKNRNYFMEVFFALKTFSKSFTNLVDIGLNTIFGLIVILAFHPGSMALIILVIAALALVRQHTPEAIRTSLELSGEKYHLFDTVQDNLIPSESAVEKYLVKRAQRFAFVKRNTIIIFALYLVGQILLLGGGAILVESNQLSIGQLVSAEIIFSNIMVSFHKLPEALENVYDAETSFLKIKKAREVVA